MTPRPPHDLVRAVRAELATPGRYRLEGPSRTGHSWIGLFLRWLGERYDDLVRTLASRLKLGPDAVSVFGDLLVFAIVVFVAIVAARLLISLQIERTARVHSRRLAAAPGAQSYVNAAVQYASRGDFSAATRVLFAAAVILLDRRGALRDDASATVNELCVALHQTNSVADEAFVALARAYTAAAYAERAIDEEGWCAVRDAYDVLDRALRA